MDKVIIALGIVFIAISIVLLLKPGIVKSLMEFFKKGKRIYLAGIARLVLAVIFLLAARDCDITWLIAAFGILFLISGISIFMLGPEKCKSIIDWFQKQSLLFIRIIAIIPLALGAVIIYAA